MPAKKSPGYSPAYTQGRDFSMEASFDESLRQAEALPLALERARAVAALGQAFDSFPPGSQTRERLRGLAFTASFPGPDGQSALLAAAKESDWTMVQSLLAHHARGDLPGPGGVTALHLAAADGHAEATRQLLNCGALANSVDQYGRTPLHYALSRENPNVAVVTELLSRHAEVNVSDLNWDTPLSLAREGVKCAGPNPYAYIIQVIETASQRHVTSSPATRIPASASTHRQFQEFR